MPGDTQKSISVSVELHVLLRDLAEMDGRSMAGEIEFLVKNEIAVRKSMADLESFKKSVRLILDSEAFKGGVSKT